jgi:hypothetical protein
MRYRRSGRVSNRHARGSGDAWRDGVLQTGKAPHLLPSGSLSVPLRRLSECEAPRRTSTGKVTNTPSPVHIPASTLTMPRGTLCQNRSRATTLFVVALLTWGRRTLQAALARAAPGGAT